MERGGGGGSEQVGAVVAQAGSRQPKKQHHRSATCCPSNCFVSFCFSSWLPVRTSGIQILSRSWGKDSLLGTELDRSPEAKGKSELTCSILHPAWWTFASGSKYPASLHSAVYYDAAERRQPVTSSQLPAKPPAQSDKSLFCQQDAV